jgi:polyhydroxyalkanoate synthesis regulator phasin
MAQKPLLEEGRPSKSDGALGNWRRSLSSAVIVFSAVVTVGCASAPVPLSETTLAALQSYHDEMEKLATSGQMSPDQAQERYYTKLQAVQPPLPGLDELLQYRRQIAAKVSTGELTQAQARANLSDRERLFLERWRELAAQYAAQQRQVEQAQSDYEQASRRQLQIEQGSGIRNLPNR